MGMLFSECVFDHIRSSFIKVQEMLPCSLFSLSAEALDQWQRKAVLSNPGLDFEVPVEIGVIVLSHIADEMFLRAVILQGGTITRPQHLSAMAEHIRMLLPQSNAGLQSSARVAAHGKPRVLHSWHAYQLSTLGYLCNTAQPAQGFTSISGSAVFRVQVSSISNIPVQAMCAELRSENS